VLADKYQAERPITAKLAEFEAYLASKASALPPTPERPAAAASAVA
jgi:hypothetical protein